MALYPFDTQKCRATFIFAGSDNDLVSLVDGSLSYLGDNIILQYVIMDIRFERNLVNKLFTE